MHISYVASLGCQGLATPRSTRGKQTIPLTSRVHLHQRRGTAGGLKKRSFIIKQSKCINCARLNASSSLRMPSFWCFLAFVFRTLSLGFSLRDPPGHQSAFSPNQQRKKRTKKIKDMEKKREEQSALLLSFKSGAWPQPKTWKTLPLQKNFFLHTVARLERRTKTTTGEGRKRRLVIKKDLKNEREPITRVIKKKMKKYPLRFLAPSNGWPRLWLWKEQQTMPASKTEN